MKYSLSIAKLFLSILVMVVAAEGFAQTTRPADVQYLLNMKTELALNNEQFDAMDSIYYNTGEQISMLDKEIQTISRSELTEEERSDKIRDLNGKKKTIRDSRDLSIELLLTDEQKKIYKEKIKPSKPSVIHMGMNHDRSNCNVCIP